MAQNTMNGTQAFQDTIAQYLMARAEKDPMFAVKLANPSKTMEQCCQFIIGEVKKSGCCGFTDDEIFGWAMHFWDEQEIKVSEISNCRVVVNHVVLKVPLLMFGATPHRFGFDIETTGIWPFVSDKFPSWEILGNNLELLRTC